MFVEHGDQPAGLVPPRPEDEDWFHGQGTPVTAREARAAPAARTRGAAADAGGGGGGAHRARLPLVKPPYGRITAIDLNKGDIVWQIAHGETPDNVRNHPALRA